MGIFKKGILGAFRGKVGNMIGSAWKGIDYMRSLPKKSSKPASDDQVAQQIKFALAVDFTKPISELVSLGFRSLSKSKVSGYNVAVSQVLTEAIVGDYPNFSIDYSKVRVSEGNLAPIAGLKGKSDMTDELTLTWKDNSSEKTANAEDELSVLIFNAEKDRYIYKDNVAKRSQGTIQESLTENFSGDMVHIYCFFVSKDGKKVSRSTYVGPVQVM